MKTHHIKSIAIAIAAVVAISGNSFAGTARGMQDQSTGYTKTIHVGPKGYTSVRYARTMPGGVS